jgi:hypothetical protein
MEEDDSPMPRLSPAVELGILERNLTALDFPLRVIHLLFNHSDFPTLRFRTHQICFFNDWTRETFDRTMHLSELSALFELSQRAVRRALSRGPEEPLPLGRHCALDATIESSIITMLRDAFQRGQPMTNEELLKTERAQYNPELTKGWVHSFIHRAAF